MKVLRTFIWPGDPLHIYHEGDVFPRPGFDPDGETVQRLAADGLIEKAEEKPVKVTKAKTKKGA